MTALQIKFAGGFQIQVDFASNKPKVAIDDWTHFVYPNFVLFSF